MILGRNNASDILHAGSWSGYRAGQSETKQLGNMHAASFATDPKHLGFVLERYRNVGRLLQGCGRVLEVGCGDGTGGHVVRGFVADLIGIDLDEILIKTAPFDAWVHDILKAPFPTANLDAVYALDVLEHIPIEREDVALSNMSANLKPFGKCIIGMPSLESQGYASPQSKAAHVNCKTENDLRETMLRHFHVVFMFGMNDCTLHTGFGPMAHYRLAVCAGKR